ncbi:DUF6457 domain-containing protein [Pseudonocardia sp.]|uniref:DUF6457 domain-containing protein n=1 Tax=Pseudonocardia sp. TaxID=60912 RepID=UPI003D14C6B1
MTEWTAAVCRELGLPESTDTAALTAVVLDMTKDVAHEVARPAAPVTAFLVGLAAGGAGGAAAVPELAARVSEMARTWSARTD